MSYPYQPQGFMQPQGFIQPQYAPQLQYAPQPQYAPLSPPIQSSFNNIWTAIILGLIIWLVFLRKNGTFSEWSNWSSCDKPCGGGKQTRTRTYTAAAFGGKEALDKDLIKEIQVCNIDACVINGKMSTWEDTNGKCQIDISDSTEITCGDGKKQQTRTYIPASNGGIELSVNSKDRKLITQWVDCSKDPCKDADGRYTEWTNLGSCIVSQTDTTPVTCRSSAVPGKQKQIRTYIEAKGDGIKITKPILEQWVECDNTDKPACAEKKDATCSDFIWDTNCTCINGVYKISKKRTKTNATGGGNNIIVCDTTPVWSRCDSIVPPDTTGLSDSIKTTFTPGGQCPADGILGSFTIADDSTCFPAVGRNRNKNKTTNYTFPIGTGSHNSDFTRMFTESNINELKDMAQNQTKSYINVRNNLETYIFTRTNNTYPQQYSLSTQTPCADIPNYTEDDIKSIWANNIGCTTTLNTDIYTKISTNYDTLKFTDIPTINTTFNPYTKASLLNSKDTAKIKICYGDSGYITVNTNDVSNYIITSILRPGIRFNAKNIIVLQFGRHKLIIAGNGKLYLYLNNAAIIYEIPLTTSGVPSYFIMQHDGNAVLYDINNVQLWSSGTGGYPGAYLELEDTGSLYIKNANGVIIKFIKDRVRDHLTSYFWNNSPDAIFSDKAGRVFPFKWTDNSVLTDGLLDPSKIPSNDCCGTYNQFRGWFRADSDDPWKERELDLTNINNYSQKSNGDKPYIGDSNELNYNTGSDRKAFLDDIQTIKLPKLLGNTMGHTNYIPGYIKISYVDGGSDSDSDSKYSYKFLIMSRGISQWNQAFVLYKKIQDRNMFADNIINNNIQVLNGLKAFYRNN